MAFVPSGRNVGRLNDNAVYRSIGTAGAIVWLEKRVYFVLLVILFVEIAYCGYKPLELADPSDQPSVEHWRQLGKVCIRYRYYL
jgi:hypothetical protein